MQTVPETLKVVSYMDAQWFLRTSKFAFDAQLPNFNPRKLTEAIAAQNKWEVSGVRMYVDIPSARDSAFWSQLWAWRINDLEAIDVQVKNFPQRTRSVLDVSCDPPRKALVRSDSDTTMMLAADTVTDFLLDKADVIVLFSNENRYTELVEHLKGLARLRDKYLKIVTAYPYNAAKATGKHTGIDRTDWFPISHELYMDCTDYIRKPGTKPRTPYVLRQSQGDTHGGYPDASTFNESQSDTMSDTVSDTVDDAFEFESSRRD